MKNARFILVIATLSASLIGCGKGVTVSQISNTPTNEIVEKQQQINDISDDKKMDSPDILGEIGQITGNEMTIKLGKMPEGAMDWNRQKPTDGEKTDETKPRALGSGTGPSGGSPGGPTQSNPGFAGGGMDRGMMGGGAGGANAGHSGISNRQNGGMKLEYTGEEKVITIPVGMPVSQRGQETATFESLKKGDLLMVWFDKEDDTIVTQISLIGGGGR